MATGSRPSVRERNRERVRDEIGSAARRLFLRQGYAATTIEEVAEEAGVSPRTVYRQFPRKEDLPFHRHETIARRLAELLDADDGQRHALDVLADALWRAIDVEQPPAGPTDPDAGTFLELLAREPELRRHEASLMGENHETVRRFLDRRLRAAGDPAPEIRAEILAGAFLGTMMAARTLVPSLGDAPPSTAIRRAVEELRPLAWP